MAFCDEREISKPGYNTFIIPSFLPMSLNVKIEVNNSVNEYWHGCRG